MKKIIILALIATLFTGCVAKKSNENSDSSIETTTAQITTEETTTIIADTNEANPAETTAVTSQETKAVTTSKANETTTAPPSAPAKTVTITTVAVPRQTASKNVTITIPTTTKQPIVTTTPVTTSRAVSNNNTSAFKQQVVDLVNAERAKVGLSALSIMPQAEAAAQVRATEIISSFSHTRPNGTSCFTALDEQGAKYMASGENIAAGQATPADVMNSWMNSPGHKANILNPKFTKIGIGYAEGGSYRTNWTQMFVG